MNIFQYIQGLRRGKEANRIEFEAMKDPFLADALEGYSEQKKNYKRQIDVLQNTITRKCRKTPKYGLIGSIAVGIVVILAIGIYLFIIEPDAGKNLFSFTHVNKTPAKTINKEPQAKDQGDKTNLVAPKTDQQTLTSTNTNTNTKQETRENNPIQPAVQPQERINNPINTNNTQPTEIANKQENHNSVIKKETENTSHTVKEQPVGTITLPKEDTIENVTAVEINKEESSETTPLISSQQQTENSEVTTEKEKVKIKGRVTDVNGNPISGASVSVIGANKRTSTNANGYFELEADDNSNLMVRSQGYDPVTLTGTTVKSMQISMQVIPVE